MKRFWFQLTLGIGVAAALFGLLLAFPFQAIAYAQAVPTDTPTLDGSHPIVIAGDEGSQVRAGPSVIDYGNPIGHLSPGDTAQAIGVSPKHDWIQIIYPQGSGDVGWVYVGFVTLSPGFLPPVEPPPTPTLVATPTLDPTLEAAFQVQPTVTRLPTFTPPASIATLPTFDNPGPQSGGGFPMAKVIIVFAIAGGLVFLISLFVRR